MLRAFYAGISVVGGDRGKLYFEAVMDELPSEAATFLEAQVDVMAEASERFAQRFTERGRREGRVEGRDEGLVDGRVDGEVTALLAVLAARGIEVANEVRDHICACTDDEQLELWIRRAATATKEADLFA